MRIYLAGTMNGLPNYGKGWRNREMRWLKQFKNIEVFSPPDREPAIVKKHGIAPELLKTKSHKIDKATRVPLYREIVKFDLREIRRHCDLVLVHLTKESAGTCSEITWAFMYDIPVHIVNATGKHYINPWLEACATTVHSSWERLRNHIRVRYDFKKEKK